MMLRLANVKGWEVAICTSNEPPRG
jgi:hypothetical protein